MRRIEVETWVQQLADHVRAGHPNEDDRVELKREWPKDHQRAARRLAGHANAAGGAPILWIIGLDATEGAVGADFEEVANWWPAVRSRFNDGVEPAMLSHVNVPVEDRVLVGLLFETERAPYVLTLSPPNGSSQLEVPFRTATATSSARRQDLLRMLAPTRTLPDVETVECHIGVEQRVPGSPSAKWRLTWRIFVVPAFGDHPTVVVHRSDLRVLRADGEILFVWPLTFGENSAAAGVVHVDRPSFLRGVFRRSEDRRAVHEDTPLTAIMTIAFAGSDRRLILREILQSCAPPEGSGDSAFWAPLPALRS